MNWLQRKIYLYNVTFGLYMLDWWERYLFNTLIIVLMWFILYNGSRQVSEIWKSSLDYAHSHSHSQSTLRGHIWVVHRKVYMPQVTMGRCKK